jgi:murein DD-endopeptidase
MTKFRNCLMAAWLVCSGAWGQTRESFDMVVPMPPSPVTIEGRPWLVYELHLTNFSAERLRLSKLEVLVDDATLATFENPELKQRLSLAALTREEVEPVQPGERAIVYLEVPADIKGSRVLRHRLRYASEDGKASAEVTGGQVSVITHSRSALAPPLRGGPWTAVYAWEWPRGHRRVFYTLEGRARLPGRLAIDWVKRDESSSSARGDADVVSRSPGYGADVLAVANARVAAVRDKTVEAERVSANPEHTLEEAAGNFIALDLGDGRFAIYEHLKPGSIRVAPGDRVRRGQVIASLGFTGDSTEPHLHFHVADSPSPLAGEGLPFEFERFSVPGTGAPSIRQRERPAPSAVVTFDP